jgi:hypothetical protein
MKRERFLLPDISNSHESARAAVGVAIYLMELALSMPTASWHSDRFFNRLQRDLPYIIHETDLPGISILLNRRYKPLGTLNEAWVRYESFENLHVKLTDEEIRAVAVREDRKMFVYGVRNWPWNSRREAINYLGRLHTLLECLPVLR